MPDPGYETALGSSTKDKITLLGQDLYSIDDQARQKLMRKIGVLFQQGALFGSLSAGENLAWPLREHSHLPEVMIRELVRRKLSVVGLAGVRIEEGPLPRRFLRDDVDRRVHPRPVVP